MCTQEGLDFTYEEWKQRNICPLYNSTYEDLEYPFRGQILASKMREDIGDI